MVRLTSTECVSSGVYTGWNRTQSPVTFVLVVRGTTLAGPGLVRALALVMVVGLVPSRHLIKYFEELIDNFARTCLNSILMALLRCRCVRIEEVRRRGPAEGHVSGEHPIVAAEDDSNSTRNTVRLRSP